MYCEKCGSLNSDDARFCKYCGAGFSSGTGDEPLQSIVRQGESASGNMNANNTGSIYYRDPVPASQPVNNLYPMRYPQYNSSKDVPFTTAFWGAVIFAMICFAVIFMPWVLIESDVRGKYDEATFALKDVLSDLFDGTGSSRTVESGGFEYSDEFEGFMWLGALWGYLWLFVTFMVHIVSKRYSLVYSILSWLGFILAVLSAYQINPELQEDLERYKRVREISYSLDISVAVSIGPWFAFIAAIIASILLLQDFKLRKRKFSDNYKKIYGVEPEKIK